MSAFGFCKCLLVFVSIVYILLGMGVLGVSLWLRFDYLSEGAAVLTTEQPVDFLQIALYITMGAGALLIILGIMGCVGASRLSICLLSAFAVVVIVVIGALIAGAVLAYLYRKQVQSTTDRQIEHLMLNYWDYSIAHPSVKVLDGLQQGLKCCGSTGPMSWVNLQGITQSRVPSSCCYNPLECERQGDITRYITSSSAGIGDRVADAIGIQGPNLRFFSQGCSQKLRYAMDTGIWITVGVLAATAVAQFIGFIAAVSLCCAI